MTSLKIFALYTLKYLQKNLPAASTHVGDLRLAIKEHVAEKYLKSSGTFNSISA